MSWLQNVLSGESKIRTELEELAAKGRDETLPPSERLQAMLELGMVVRGGTQLQEMIDKMDDEPETKEEPKYRWVNGARVKTK